jgi:hypothetical protein
MHQKHPPAKVAVSATLAESVVSGATEGESVASDEGVQESRRNPTRRGPRLARRCEKGERSTYMAETKLEKGSCGERINRCSQGSFAESQRIVPAGPHI